MNKVDEVHQVHQVDPVHQVNEIDEVHQVNQVHEVNQVQWKNRWNWSAGVRALEFQRNIKKKVHDNSRREC